ncbi:hypothetical protein [Streptomyces sp. NBC_00211]|uniref:hypothetical protein n=1 Tax=Streptomyces sp. NBC_00211 TaxID=2975683 RepID=UPI003253B747
MHNARSDGEAELAEKALAPVLALCEEERAAILAEGTYGPAPPSTALPPFPQLEGTLAPAPDTVRAAVYVAPPQRQHQHLPVPVRLNPGASSVTG